MNKKLLPGGGVYSYEALKDDLEEMFTVDFINGYGTGSDTNFTLSNSYNTWTYKFKGTDWVNVIDDSTFLGDDLKSKLSSVGNYFVAVALKIPFLFIKEELQIASYNRYSNPTNKLLGTIDAYKYSRAHNSIWFVPTARLRGSSSTNDINIEYSNFNVYSTTSIPRISINIKTYLDLKITNGEVIPTFRDEASTIGIAVNHNGSYTLMFAYNTFPETHTGSATTSWQGLPGLYIGSSDINNHIQILPKYTVYKPKDTTYL